MLGLMNTKSIIPGTLVEGSIINNNTSTDDIKQLKAQLQDMQMEIDILKGTINVLKKDPGIDQRALCNRGIIGGCLFVYKIKIYTVFNSSQKMIFWNHGIYIKDYHLELSALFSHHKKWPPAIDIISIPYRKPFLFSLSTGPFFHRPTVKV